MSKRLKSWFPVLLAVLSLGAGYTLARLDRDDGDDMMDAVRIVQRRSPQFLISEPYPSSGWTRKGTVYLCCKPYTVDEVESLNQHPARPDPRWSGVVCFRGTDDPDLVHHPWVSDGGSGCIEYAKFAIYGDRDMVRKVQAILAEAGFQPKK